MPYIADSSASACFNTQPPEGGWANNRTACHTAYIVSTHSRPKAAGFLFQSRMLSYQYSFNTQPPEGGWRLLPPLILRQDRFNTQPPEGGWGFSKTQCLEFVEFQHTAARRRLGPMSPVSGDRYSFNTQPPEGGWQIPEGESIQTWPFQHTAARRRLVDRPDNPCCTLCGFNTQPPEGGWATTTAGATTTACFNTQPPEGGWVLICHTNFFISCFNTQPPEGGWEKIRDKRQRQRVSTHSRPKAAGLACGDFLNPINGFNTQPPEGGW